MVAETLVFLATVFAIEFVAGAIAGLLELWGQRKLPETAQAELSDFDKEKIRETQELLRECFGEDVTECIRKANNKDRIVLMADFAEKLAYEYGLDIDVDVTVNNVHNCGSYDWKQRKAVFNIALLMVDGNNEHFEYCVHETIDTIIHELRHAVQHHTIENAGFWSVDEVRRNSWANNMLPGNYIRPEVDMRGYAAQPIEKDAVTFASLVMKGVK